MGYTELDIEGLGILITNLIVNYKNEAFYSDNLLINIGLGCVKRTSIDLIYHAIVQETKKEIATALTTITFYDYQRTKVSRIPPQFLNSIITRIC
jgi:4-hydroxybenzoyl-CoA thioesterase